MASTPDDPRVRRSRTRATNVQNSLPISEDEVPASLVVPVFESVELRKAENEGRRDRQHFLISFTPQLLSGLALLALLALGAVLVFTGKLEAQTYMGYFASLIAGYGVGKKAGGTDKAQ